MGTFESPRSENQAARLAVPRSTLGAESSREQHVRLKAKSSVTSTTHFEFGRRFLQTAHSKLQDMRFLKIVLCSTAIAL